MGYLTLSVIIIAVERIIIAVVYYCICSNKLLHMISLRSTLRRKLLTYFYVNRSARVYVRQLAEKLGVDSTNLSRELARLEQEGLLESEVEGRQRYYRINPRYTHLNAVFSLLQGTVGLVPTLASSLQRVSGIEHAYLYGSFAKNEADSASDIDVLILGQPDASDLATEVARVEKILNREISYTVFKPQELKRKLAARDAFLTDIWRGKRIEVI
jgi:predicted nucleotidyltransferase/DNA-binding transcriptional ArsR family regulator